MNADNRANVTALTAVVPADLTAADITPRIGAVWISPADHQQFLQELLEHSWLTVAYGGGNAWEVKNAPRHSVAATSRWGTDRIPADEIFAHLLTQKPILIYDTGPDREKIFNPVATEAAGAKADAIAEKFTEWIWQDPERASRLAGEYNRLFNSIVLRDYTAEGARLTLPGLAATRTPRPHQLAAVARMICEPTAGLFHEVGAGKTGEMVMGVMELRRLHLAAKPVVVVPNHMLGQFSREWLQWYPAARVLAADSSDLAAENRRDFVARVATGDWDGIVMTRTAFQALSVSPQVEADYLAAELDMIRAQLDTAKANGATHTVKQVEKKLLAQEERIKASLDVPRDPGISFEDTGIDYIVIDEAHAFKNLATASAIADANITGSNRARDLHMKLELLRRRHGARIATFATATPIANSITEAHVMCRYLRPDLLAAAGVEQFDRWAATFGQLTTALELKPTGGGYQSKTRFARFGNVPEMLMLWRVFADVKTAADLNLPTPDLAARPDGKHLPETVVVPPTAALTDYGQQLLERAKKVSRRPEKGGDIILTILADGRKAALDTRLVGLPADGTQKLDVAADRIHSIWRANLGNVYLDDTGRESPITGALQIVFCDQSTPHPGVFNAYEHLKALLVQRGMPPGSIRFMHDAGSDPVKKENLFTAARSGQIAVLIGSTEKMGVGTNIQNRAVALHHIDCPWRPADLAQRDGRILRQGNQNQQVEIIRYTTGRSLDAFSWQTVQRKARFIDQVMHGRPEARDIEDIGDAALSMAETVAAITGDTLMLDKAQIDMNVARLLRLHRAWQQERPTLNWRIHQCAATIASAAADAPAIAAAAGRLTDTAGEKFAATIDAVTYPGRADAAAALRDAIAHRSAPYTSRPRPLPIRIELAGLEFTVTQQPGAGGFAGNYLLAIDGVPRTGWTIRGAALADGIGVIRQVENHAAALPDLLATTRAAAEAAAEQQRQAQAQLAVPFKHADQLDAARAQQHDINRRIAEKAADQQAADRPPPDPQADRDDKPEPDAAAIPSSPAPGPFIASPPAAREADDQPHGMIQRETASPGAQRSARPWHPRPDSPDIRRDGEHPAPRAGRAPTYPAGRARAHPCGYDSLPPGGGPARGPTLG